MQLDVLLQSFNFRFFPLMQPNTANIRNFFVTFYLLALKTFQDSNLKALFQKPEIFNNSGKEH